MGLTKTSMDDFLIRALIGGIGVAILCGPLGCLVVWQRMTYFGAALSHAALLGVALGIYLQINLTLSILGICIAVSGLLVMMGRNTTLTSDTALGILAHGSLALGVLVLSLIPSLRLDLMSYLFGDILSISWQDIIWIYAGGSVVIAVLLCIWPRILSLIIQRDLALVDGVVEENIRLIFLILLSFVVAMSMQIVGILLIVSLLIIPAAAARKFSSSPEQMALMTIVIGIVAVALGLGLSLLWDTPAGPSIVVCATTIFLLTTMVAAKNHIHAS